MVGGEKVEVGGGLSDRERDEVAVREEDVGLLRRRRENEVGGEGKEVAESETERVFESGKECL